MAPAPTSKASLLLAGLALCALPATAEIYRCTAKGGAVTYQQIPCPGSENGTVLDVPASYPAADAQERERLFQREAALDRRLEAERERLSRESIARALQPPLPPTVEPAEPQVIWPIAPLFRAHRTFPHPRMGPRDPRRG
jgi:hypothetical protein